MNQGELNTRFVNLSVGQQTACNNLIAGIVGEQAIVPANDFVPQYENDLDDSSDEEEIKLCNSTSYDAVGQWQRFKEENNLPTETLAQYQISFLAHAIGIAAFYSPQVEDIYRGADGLKSHFLKSDTNIVEGLLQATQNAFCAALKPAGLDCSKVNQVENLVKFIAVNHPEMTLPFDLLTILKDEKKLKRFFNRLETCLKSTLGESAIFDQDFAQNFTQRSGVEMQKIFLDEMPQKSDFRKVLQGNENFLLNNENDLFAALRLMQRSGKRQELTLEEDYDPLDSQSFLLKYTAIAQESYQERNVANWNGEKSSKVYPYGEYEAVANIVKYFASKEISGARVADWVLNIFDRTTEINILPQKEKEYLAALHHLFFGDEVEKNPSCYVTNRAAFKMLIDGKMLWEEFLNPCAVTIMGVDHPTVPAVLSGENSILIARQLNALYQDYMPLPVNHSLPRSHAILDVGVMVEREANLIRKWLNFYQKEVDASQLLGLMEDALLGLDQSTNSNSNQSDEVPAKKIRITKIIKTSEQKAIGLGGQDV